MAIVSRPMNIVMRSMPARHEHHAERRAEHQEVVLAGAGALDLEVPPRHQDRERPPRRRKIALKKMPNPSMATQAARDGRRRRRPYGTSASAGRGRARRPTATPASRGARAGVSASTTSTHEQAGRQDQLGQQVPEVGERQPGGISACLRGRAPRPAVERRPARPSAHAVVANGAATAPGLRARRWPACRSHPASRPARRSAAGVRRVHACDHRVHRGREPVEERLRDRGRSRRPA